MKNKNNNNMAEFKHTHTFCKRCQTTIPNDEFESHFCMCTDNNEVFAEDLKKLVELMKSRGYKDTVWTNEKK